MAPRRTAAVVLATALIGVSSACSWGGGDDVSATQSERAAAEMRPVPTVSGDDADAASGTGDDQAAAASDPDAGPPVTEVIGDPQPDPDAPEPRPPLPASPVVGACDRIADIGAIEAIATASGVAVELEPIGEQACRVDGSSVVAEVHFVSEADVESDWFRRDGIEPVGEVGGDAVGLVGFLAPGADPATGYTIAALERREGIVVAVRGAGDDRAIAAELAVIVAASI